jgi:hypothetical protein
MAQMLPVTEALPDMPTCRLIFEMSGVSAQSQFAKKMQQLEKDLLYYQFRDIWRLRKAGHILRSLPLRSHNFAIALVFPNDGPAVAFVREYMFRNKADLPLSWNLLQCSRLFFITIESPNTRLMNLTEKVSTLTEKVDRILEILGSLTR